ncbi:MAG: type II secretion system protein GspD, partial [Luminiphilus sp.]|nr:type II secretion system protein GspD [Luminiphilus sp.]
MKDFKHSGVNTKLEGLHCSTARNVALALVIATSVMACADMSTKSLDNKAIDAAVPLTSSASALAQGEVETDEAAEAEAIKYRGNDQLVAMPEVKEPIRFVGDAVTLSFENAPLSEVTHAVLSDVLGVDYLVDGPIPGEVTLRTRTPIERDQLLTVLESLLKANNVYLIRGRDNRYIVSSSQGATGLVPRVVSRDDQEAGYSTMVIPLQYISAGGMAEILKPLAGEQAFLRVDNAR